MIRPTALYNAARFSRDVNSIGRVLAVLCGNPRVRREDLTDAELTTLEIVENENEEMEKNLAKQREEQRERQRARREERRRQKEQNPENSECDEKSEESSQNDDISKTGVTRTPPLSREHRVTTRDNTNTHDVTVTTRDNTNTPLVTYQSNNQTINQSNNQTNKQPEPNPNRPERACAGARVRVREGDDIPPPPPELIPPAPPSVSGSASASGRLKSLVSSSASAMASQLVSPPPPRKKRLDVYALADSDFFSPEYAALDLFVAACGAGFWARAIRALGDAECREELNAFIHEVRAGETVKNPAAVMTKRLQALARRKNIPL